MKLVMKVFIPILFLVIAATPPAWSGETGKIAGIVTDKATGEPLAGANIVIVGTSLGASANVEGQYTILYVPPGMYQVQASLLGYVKVTIKEAV